MSAEAKKVASLLQHLSNQDELLQDENKGLRNALTTKKKHNKKSKVLHVQQRQEYHGGAVFWSPRKMAEGKARECTNKQLAEEEKLQKAQMKPLQAANVLYNKKLKEERRVATAAKREEREKEKTKRPLGKQLKKQLKTLRKLSHFPKMVSVRPHPPSCQNLSNRSVLVVLQHLLKLNLLFQPSSAAAATWSSSQADTHNVISTSCLQ
jgi:hypothetical protein